MDYYDVMSEISSEYRISTMHHTWPVLPSLDRNMTALLIQKFVPLHQSVDSNIELLIKK